MTMLVTTGISAWCITLTGSPPTELVMTTIIVEIGEIVCSRPLVRFTGTDIVSIPTLVVVVSGITSGITVKNSVALELESSMTSVARLIRTSGSMKFTLELDRLATVPRSLATRLTDPRLMMNIEVVINSVITGTVLFTFPKKDLALVRALPFP